MQDPTFEVRAAIQAARTDVPGPSTMPTATWVNSKGQGSELKAPVPSFLRPRDQDAAPWPTVQSPATDRELPSRAPELNPVENILQNMLANWVSNRVFDHYDAIVEAACEARKKLTRAPDTIRSIGMRDWAHVGWSE